MFNADGSEAETRGNGVRVAKYLFDHGLTRKKQVKIETGVGILTLDSKSRATACAASASTWVFRSSS